MLVSGNTYSVYTEADYHYNYAWLRPLRYHFEFKAKACKDVTILLASDMQETTVAYEIVFGGHNNEQTDIRRGAQGPILAYAYTPRLCNCDEFHPFWVRWENKLIEVGTGQHITHTLVSYDDKDQGHEVKAVSLTTYHDSVGLFQFGSHACESLHSPLRGLIL